MLYSCKEPGRMQLICLSATLINCSATQDPLYKRIFCLRPIDLLCYISPRVYSWWSDSYSYSTNDVLRIDTLAPLICVFWKEKRPLFRDFEKHLVYQQKLCPKSPSLDDSHYTPCTSPAYTMLLLLHVLRNHIFQSSISESWTTWRRAPISLVVERVTWRQRSNFPTHWTRSSLDFGKPGTPTFFAPNFCYGSYFCGSVEHGDAFQQVGMTLPQKGSRITQLRPEAQEAEHNFEVKVCLTDICVQVPSYYRSSQFYPASGFEISIYKYVFAFINSCMSIDWCIVIVTRLVAHFCRKRTGRVANCLTYRSLTTTLFSLATGLRWARSETPW